MAQPEELFFETILEARCRELLDAIIDALPEEQRPVRTIYLVPGFQIVWDQCCEGGQLTARLARLTAHTTNSNAPFPCIIDYWTAQIEVVILRCAATVDNQGVAPTATTLTAEGLRGAADLGVLLREITVLDWVTNVVPYQPIGPAGGCVDIGWLVETRLDATPCS